VYHKEIVEQFLQKSLWIKKQNVTDIFTILQAHK